MSHIDHLTASVSALSPFNAGDVVICTDDYDYQTHLTVGKQYVITKTYGNLVTVISGRTGRCIDAFHSRFKPVNEPTKDVSVYELIDKHAKALDKAIAAGTMVAPYSSIGALSDFLREYVKLTEEL